MQINLHDNTTNQPLTDKDEIQAVEKIANRTLCQLVADNPDLLIFPPDLFQNDTQQVGDQDILKCQLSHDRTSATVTTGNIMGFIGTDHGDINIISRFANSSDLSNDFFLHYMLQSVFNFGLYNLHHSAENEYTGFDWRFYFFPYYLTQALRQGLYKEYKTFRHNDARVKGSIDVPRHIRQNLPFMGNIAYTTREYAHDNPMTQLVRHTIEYINHTPIGKALLTASQDTRNAIAQITASTLQYNPSALHDVIKYNSAHTVNHPYFSNYRPLQTLCLQILRHEKIRYSDKNDEKVYGILFDGAWLWEEYLNTIFCNHKLGFSHPRNKEKSGGFHLAEDCYIRYPDFYIDNISEEKSVIIDAKYKRQIDTRDDINQMITYLYRLRGRVGGFLLPTTQIQTTETHRLLGYGLGKAKIKILRHLIPQDAITMRDFIEKIRQNEQQLVAELLEI